jgi:urea carboxylase-associated protein 2
MKAIYSEVLPPGAMWSMRIPRWRTIRLTALDPQANVSALLYNAVEPLDRLNVPDTLKALHTAKLTRGHVLMSDMGHALASITADSLGWHDPLGGHITKQQVTEKFGEKAYQEHRNAFQRSAHANFLIELMKHGLGLADLVANINFFSKVSVDSNGRMQFDPDHCSAGVSVDLRTEMDTLVILSNTPHPMHPGGAYPAARVEVAVFPSEEPGQDDFCRTFRPECGRAMALSERLYL